MIESNKRALQFWYEKYQNRLARAHRRSSNVRVTQEAITKKTEKFVSNFGNLKERILQQIQHLEKYYDELTKEQRELEAKIGSLKTEKGSYQVKMIRGYGPYLYWVSNTGKWMYIGKASERMSDIKEKHEKAKKVFAQLKGVLREKRRIIKTLRKVEELLREV